jgi:hypothetical protein
MQAAVDAAETALPASIMHADGSNHDHNSSGGAATTLWVPEVGLSS